MTVDPLVVLSLTLTAVFVVALLHGAQHVLLGLGGGLSPRVEVPSDHALSGAAWILRGGAGVLVMCTARGMAVHS